MQNPFTPSSGIAYPDDLKRLRQVFDHICRKYDFVEGSGDWQDVAQAVMSLFSSGVFDENELTTSLEEFVRRRSG